ncbi:MAG: chorismate mutase [Oscillospiraceae bacterium]|nr:chorismate mutase [Oscillospiraceae bacterium]
MTLEELRGEIDSVDDSLLALFERRMELAREVWRYKEEHALPLRDRERERKLLYRLCEKAPPALAEYAAALFSSLMELSASYQAAQNQRDSAVKRLLSQAAAHTPKEFPARAAVACQGVEGAYSQAACDKLFSLADITYMDSFEGVFQAVESGLCRFGVLPLENSSAGSVNEVYDLLGRYQFHIVRGVKLPIAHSLLAPQGTKLEDVREVFSHEQALRQCSQFLKSLNGVKVTESENTARAARQVAGAGRGDAAVISSLDCAELYGLSVLSYHVQNSDSNYTRFICVSKEPEIYPGAHRTSLMLALKHRPGALYHVLARFYTHGINLNKLESRPIPGREFAFMFYFDIETPVISDSLQQLLAELEREADMFRYLGTYQEF